MSQFAPVPYTALNSRQKENYNFHKVAARLVIDRKYQGKGIHIAFIHGDEAYLYDHDRLVRFLEANALIGDESVTWHEKGIRHWPKPPAWAVNFLEDFRI